MPKPEKNILFTFDYELFLGKRSGNIDGCVIKPTEKLLDIFSEHKLSSGIFFVDTTWLLKLREIAATTHAARADYEKVAQQLRHISNLGHYVFPHLHPHWANASYITETNQWQLVDYSRYRIHSLEKKEREKLFAESVGLLREILGDNYKPIGYRAGGWSIQPFEDFEPLFRQHGVRYDFSVLPGSKCISTGQYYDFSDVSDKEPYSFSKDVTISTQGDFTEFPISTIKFSAVQLFFNKLLLKYLSLSGDRSFGNGQGIVTEVLESSSGKGEMVSIELLTRVKLPMYLQFVKQNNYMQFIAHPKMLTSHNLATFEKFLRKALDTYEVNTDFIKCIKA